jgi:sugar fermentation stimulation protein A
VRYIVNPVDGILVKRVNRFIAEVTLDRSDEVIKAHVPNTGRMVELMVPGEKILLEPAANRDRKTAFTLKSIRHNNRWVCVDTTVPNAFAAGLAQRHALPFFDGYETITREHTIGRHRFDLRLDGEGAKPLLIEVKSVTLVEGRIARFPDAPTERGRSHLDHLAALTREGYSCGVLFIIQRSDAIAFEPNELTDPAFGEALRNAVAAGVSVAAVKLSVGREQMKMIGSVDIGLRYSR